VPSLYLLFRAKTNKENDNNFNFSLSIEQNLKKDSSILDRESTFIMPRGGGMKMLRGAPKCFLALKGGGSESSRYIEGGFGPAGAWSVHSVHWFTPTIVNRIDGLETH
jgi:hypothetical protein